MGGSEVGDEGWGGRAGKGMKKSVKRYARMWLLSVQEVECESDDANISSFLPSGRMVQCRPLPPGRFTHSLVRQNTVTFLLSLVHNMSCSYTTWRGVVQSSWPCVYCTFMFTIFCCCTAPTRPQPPLF